MKARFRVQSQNSERAGKALRVSSIVVDANQWFGNLELVIW